MLRGAFGALVNEIKNENFVLKKTFFTFLKL